MDKITIPLEGGYKLVVEQNKDSAFNKELFVYVETETGMCWQELAVVRPAYTLEEDSVKYKNNLFEILVHGNANSDDITDKFVVPLYEENE